MAHYIVTAKIKKESVEKLKDSLNKNLFYKLQLFGRALTFSLKNAKVLNKDTAIWEEEDLLACRQVIAHLH